MTGVFLFSLLKAKVMTKIVWEDDGLGLLVLSVFCEMGLEEEEAQGHNRFMEFRTQSPVMLSELP